jgi:hypothetical protein
MNDLQDLTIAQLDNEFDRLAALRDACQESMASIRNEKMARRDREIAELKVALAQQSS